MNNNYSEKKFTLVGPMKLDMQEFGLNPKRSWKQLLADNFTTSQTTFLNG